MSKSKRNPSNKIKKGIQNSRIAKIFRSFGRVIDLLFSNNVLLTVAALAMGFGLYLYVTGVPYELDLNYSDTRTLESVHVQVINNDTAKVVDIYNSENEVLDEDELYVDVIVKGPRNEVLKIANNPEDYSLILDTSEVKDGETKDVYIIADNVPDKVTVTTSPASFRVAANKRIVAIDYLLEPETVNETKMGKNLTIESVSLKSYDVQVSGSSEKLDQVASVKALIDVSGITSPGTVAIEEDKITYVAHDNSGHVVDVDISVKEAGAEVIVSDYYKEVPLNLVFEGEAPEGKSVASYETDVKVVNIYGNKEEISDVEYVEATVDLNDMKSGVTSIVKIELPDGAVSMSEDQAKVKVSYEDTVSTVVEGVPVEYSGLGSEYSVQAATDGELKIDVTISGAQSVIDKITVEDIKLYVDLTGLEVGEHTVPVQIKDPISIIDYDLSQNNIVVKIEAK